MMNLPRQRVLSQDKGKFAMEPWGTSIFRRHVEEEKWTEWSLSPVGKLENLVCMVAWKSAKEGVSRRKEWSIVSNLAECWVGRRQRNDLEFAIWIYKYHWLWQAQLQRRWVVGRGGSLTTVTRVMNGRKGCGSYGYRHIFHDDLFWERGVPGEEMWFREGFFKMGDTRACLWPIANIPAERKREMTQENSVISSPISLSSKRARY